MKKHTPITMTTMLGLVCLLILAWRAEGPKPIKAETEPEVKSGFSAQQDSLNPLKVHFENESKGGDLYVWHFGDYTSSMTRNPTHTYPGPGIYLAELIVLTDSLHDKTVHRVVIPAEE